MSQTLVCIFLTFPEILFCGDYKSSLGTGCQAILVHFRMAPTPISTKEMRVLEFNSEYLGVSLGTLMQSAGREVARVIESEEEIDGKNIVILCGLGGNGGDGMVAARYLSEGGAAVSLYLVGHEQRIASPDTRENWNVLQNLQDIHSEVLRTESDVKSCKPIAKADIIIDALLGFGVKSKVREPILTAVKKINKASAKKYAIDIPTGIDSDTGKVHGKAVIADVTITLHTPKIGMEKAESNVGKLFTVPIGIPPEASRTAGPGDLWLFNRPRKATAHKGQFGRILVIGGSDVYSGAPALAGLAALRTGADLVSLMVPDPVLEAVRGYSPNLMVTGLKENVLTAASANAVIKKAEENNAIAIGPGLGLAEETLQATQFIIEALAKRSKPQVIDADGLKSLRGANIRLHPERTILTPHWAELETIMDKSLGDSKSLENRIDKALLAAKEFLVVVLLKGAVDVIAHPDGRYKTNRTGVPAMTVGGTGDVLTGIASTLLSRGEGAFYAAAAAAFVSGRAGEAAHRELGDHITATDCVEKISEVFNQAM
jgi:NAD(P)H-hydrate epimerase